MTLPELLTVLVIMAILMSIAYPSYTRYTVRGSQAATQEFMLEVMSRAEQYRMDVRDYPGDIVNDLGMSIPDRVSDFYDLTSAANNSANPPRLTLTAVPRENTRQEDEPTLVLDSTGLRTPEAEW